MELRRELLTAEMIDPAQRQLAEVPPPRFDAYLEAERRSGERHLGNTGNVEWLVSFAPIAPAELRAFLRSVASTAELEASLIAELGHGLALALGAYAEMGFESFNLAIYGALPEAQGYPLNLRLACRSNLKPFYRSDSTFLERLHWEGRLIFLINGALLMLCVPDEDDLPATDRLVRPYFGTHRFEWPDDPAVEFHLPHGEMIALLRRSGFEVEELIEIRPPDGSTTRYPYVTLEWAQRWPCEEVWKARKPG